LFFSGCSVFKASTASPDAAEVLEKGAYQKNENGQWEFHDPITSGKSMQETKDKIIGWLEEANVGYKYIVRDEFYIEGKSIPAIWIFAVNDYGDALDILILPEYKEKMIEFWHKDHCLKNVRKNEMLSYQHFWHYPPEYGSNGISAFGRSGVTEDGIEYEVIFAGSELAFFDVHNYNFDLDMDNEGVIYWDGTNWAKSQIRPEEMNVPIDYDSDSGDLEQYRTYKPAESLEDEVSAMQKRLENTGRGYHWTIQDSIVVNDVTYPVTWMYAVNENEEWVDVVFTKDANLAYILQQNRSIFEDLRHEQVIKLNNRYMGRILNQNADYFADRHEYLIQDCFYHDYYYYMDGNPMAMMDCGCLIQTYSWSEEDQEYMEFISREGILDKNIKRMNIPIPE